MAGFALLLYKNTLFLDSLDALQEERAGRAARAHEECDRSLPDLLNQNLQGSGLEPLFFTRTLGIFVF